MKLLRNIFIITFFFIFMEFLPAFAKTSPIKIGVIDVKKVVRESIYGKAVMEKLQRKYEALSRKIKQKMRELESLKKEIQTKSDLWSDEVRVKKQRLYQKKLRELKELQEDSQYEMKELEKKLLDPVFAELEKVIKKFVKDNHYDLILEKNQPGLYYASPRVDLTPKIIKLFNKYYLNKKRKGKK